jgi:hypothetical protein
MKKLAPDNIGVKSVAIDDLIPNLLPPIRRSTIYFG